MKWKMIIIGLLLFNSYNKLVAQEIKFNEKGKLIGEIPNYIDLFTKPAATLSINVDTKMTTVEQKKETNKLEKKYAGNVTKSDGYYKYDEGFPVPAPGAARGSYIFDKKIDLNISLNRVLAYTTLNGTSSNAINLGEFDKVLYKVDNGVVPEIDITTSSLTLCGVCSFDKIKLKKVNVKNAVIKEKYEKAIAGTAAIVGPPAVAAVSGYVPLVSTITDADIQRVKSEMQVYYDKLKDIYYNDGTTIDDELLSNISDYSSKHTEIIKGLNIYIKDNTDWLKNTAFINGVPTLNPLGFTDENEISAKIALKEKELKLKESERVVLDGLYEKSKKINMLTIDVAFEKYKKKKIEIERSILSLMDEITSLKKQLTDNEKIKKAWGNCATVLNEVQLFPTKKEKEPIYMRHHDATNNMISMDNNVLPFEFKRYEEDENIKVLLHNLEAGKYKGTFDTTIVSITETALFTENVLPVINGITTQVGSFPISFPLSAQNIPNVTTANLKTDVKNIETQFPGFAATIKLNEITNLKSLNINLENDETLQQSTSINPTNLLSDLKFPATKKGITLEYSIKPKDVVEKLTHLTLNNVSTVFSTNDQDLFINNIDLTKLNKLIDLENARIEGEKYKNINTFITNYAMVNWLSTQTTPQPFPDLEDAGPVYKTEVFEAKPNDRIPSSVTYSVGRQNKTDSTDKSKAGFNYKVYKKQYIQFTAMAAFFPVAKKNLDETGFNQRTVISYDGSNNTFTTNNYKPYDIVVGAKIYPFGLNIRKWLPVSGVKQKNKEYRSILFKRGDLIGNRFSIMVGLGVSQKQLRNYFFGIGYEIVPGCGINGGVNIYSTPYYNIEQNKLVSTKEHFKPAYFLGFSFDPIVLIQAIALGKL